VNLQYINIQKTYRNFTETIQKQFKTDEDNRENTYREDIVSPDTIS